MCTQGGYVEANFKRLYMLKMKARYAKAKTRKERSALIDEAVVMTHYSRKYVIRLLNGSRRHRKHRGRKPSYSGDAHQLLIRIWRAEGYMCPLYLKSIIGSAIRDYEELGHDVPPALADELTRMSASTMYRILRPHHIRRAPNKRSGSKASLAAQIPADPGALEETGEPGILQVDTVALCGGDMRESFFWILHVTDAATQWGALAPCWNRGAEATANALAHLLEQLPFPPKVIHVDRNAPEPKAKGHGSEFLNHHLLAFLRTHHPDVRLTRSRPYRKNDNNRIEQKNGSVVRALFGDLRFSDHSQLPALTQLCDEWSLLNNHAIPCTCQLSKIRRTDVKGLAYRRIIDTPRTPWQRLNALLPQPPPPHLNAILLRRRCEKTLRRLFLTQHP